jgi:hypothetical protein
MERGEAVAGHHGQSPVARRMRLERLEQRRFQNAADSPVRHPHTLRRPNSAVNPPLSFLISDFDPKPNSENPLQPMQGGLDTTPLQAVRRWRRTTAERPKRERNSSIAVDEASGTRDARARNPRISPAGYCVV